MSARARVVQCDIDASDGLPILRNAASPHELVENLAVDPLHSCWDVFVRGSKSKGLDWGVIGTRISNNYVWTSFKKLGVMSFRFYNGLKEKELVSKLDFGELQVEPIGILAKNRLEWFVTEYAANLGGLTLVPLYETLGNDALLHIVRETRMRTAVCSVDRWHSLSKLLRSGKDSLELKNIILLPPSPCVCSLGCSCCSSFTGNRWTGVNNLKSIQAEANDYNIRLFTFGSLIGTSQLCAEAKELLPCLSWDNKSWDEINPCELKPKATMDTINTICYTSGTTGAPKGAMITHRILIGLIAGIVRGVFNQPELNFNGNDVHYSYLPLAHVFERTITILAVYLGGKIGISSGDHSKMLEDLAILKPTVFLAVPRVLETIDKRISAKLDEMPFPIKAAMNTALSLKLNKHNRCPSAVSSIFLDPLFTSLRRLIGGRVRFFLVGGAPIQPSLQSRIACLFSAPVVQGYGMTETTGPSFLAHPNDAYGGIGAPVPCIEFKIIGPVVTTSAYGPDNHGGKTYREGELCVRGSSTAYHGYFCNKEATDQLIDSGGWLHTGDIVSFCIETQKLRVVDRLKSIFKLAQGEYVAPEKIQCVYAAAPLISQIFVHGDSFARRPVAAVVPDEQAVKTWSSGRTLADVLSVPEYKAKLTKEILAQMEDVGAQLNGFEKVKDIVLLDQPFTVENGFLTPTLKQRRHNIKKALADVLPVAI